MLLVSQMRRFLCNLIIIQKNLDMKNFTKFNGFFKFWIKKTHRKKLSNIWNYEPCYWVVSEYTQRFQIFFSLYAVFYELSKFEAPEVRKR